MIQISPIQNNITVCPSCASTQTVTHTILYPGIHVAAECTCSACQYKYIQDLPVGHACYYPVSIGINDKKVTDLYSIDWYTQQFATSYSNQNTAAVRMERIVNHAATDVIVINCLDYLYGHVLLKLFNVSFYKKQHPGKGIVVIVPKNYVWLVPAYVDEIWAVDLKLSQCKEWYASIHEQISLWMASFLTADLAYAFPHPCTEQIQIESYSRVPAFDLKAFTGKKLTVTFIYRTDRLWHQSKAEYYVFLVLRKTGLLKFTSFLFPGLQNRSIQKMERLLRKKFPELVFNVAGMGKRGTFSSSVTDLRSDKPNPETERQWCEAYANSHVVVGIHGSNMLLPTAHAASFVELLPMDRTGNLTQDIITRYEGRAALFLGRFIPDTASPALVANQVKAIYKGWPLFDLYNNPANQLFEKDTEMSFLKNLRNRILKALK